MSSFQDSETKVEAKAWKNMRGLRTIITLGSNPFVQGNLSLLSKVLCLLGIHLWVHPGHWEYRQEGSCQQDRECKRCGGRTRPHHHYKQGFCERCEGTEGNFCALGLHYSVWKYRQEGYCLQDGECRRCGTITRIHHHYQVWGDKCTRCGEADPMRWFRRN